MESKALKDLQQSEPSTVQASPSSQSHRQPFAPLETFFKMDQNLKQQKDTKDKPLFITLALALKIPKSKSASHALSLAHVVDFGDPRGLIASTTNSKAPLPATESPLLSSNHFDPTLAASMHQSCAYIFRPTPPVKKPHVFNHDDPLGYYASLVSVLPETATKAELSGDSSASSQPPPPQMNNSHEKSSSKERKRSRSEPPLHVFSRAEPLQSLPLSDRNNRNCNHDPNEWVPFSCTITVPFEAVSNRQSITLALLRSAVQKSKGNGEESQKKENVMVSDDVKYNLIGPESYRFTHPKTSSMLFASPSICRRADRKQNNNKVSCVNTLLKHGKETKDQSTKGKEEDMVAFVSVVLDPLVNDYYTTPLSAKSKPRSYKMVAMKMKEAEDIFVRVSCHSVKEIEI